MDKCKGCKYLIYVIRKGVVIKQACKKTKHSKCILDAGKEIIIPKIKYTLRVR